MEEVQEELLNGVVRKGLSVVKCAEIQMKVSLVESLEEREQQIQKY